MFVEGSFLDFQSSNFLNLGTTVMFLSFWKYYRKHFMEGVVMNVTISQASFHLCFLLQTTGKSADRHRDNVPCLQQVGNCWKRY